MAQRHARWHSEYRPATCCPQRTWRRPTGGSSASNRARNDQWWLDDPSTVITGSVRCDWLGRLVRSTAGRDCRLARMALGDQAATWRKDFDLVFERDR